jgi:hypothetical protein
VPKSLKLREKCLSALARGDFAGIASTGSAALPSLFSIFKDGLHTYQIAGVVLLINDPSGIHDLFEMVVASKDYGLGYFVCRLARKKGIHIPENIELMSEKLIDLGEGSDPKFLNDIEAAMTPFV